MDWNHLALIYPPPERFIEWVQKHPFLLTEEWSSIENQYESMV